VKIYTKTGDMGETALFGGRRVSKAHARIEAYGLVDQLNAQLGIVALHMDDQELGAHIQRVQSQLFDLGADLATPIDVESDYIVRISVEQIEELEQEIDQMETELTPLKTFILPGGAPAAAYLHMARTICRQAERATVHLSSIEQINEHALVLLNRLSDWFFVMARVCNHRKQLPDVPWISPSSKSGG